jgi:integrase
VRATLNCLFQTAADWHYLKENPASKLRLPEGLPAAKAKVLSPEQMSMVIGRLSDPYRTMVMISVTTAVRESELFALSDEDFDLGSCTVTIQRRLYRGKLGRVKTKKSERGLPLCPEVVEAVRNLRHEGPFLFLEPDGSGEASLEHKARDEFNKVAEALGIPHFTWRSFRRSAESAMHNNKVPLKAQQAVMGHSSPNMTLEYAETDEVSKRQAVEELGKLIFPKFSQLATGVAIGAAN